MEKTQIKNEFTQLCIFTGTTCKTPEDFIDQIATHFGCRFKYAEQVTTLPGHGGDGGRIDQLFYIHSDDIGKFAVPRLSFGIKWWEDALANGIEDIYPEDVSLRHPKKW